MGVLNQILQVVLSLSILVVIHELGHFIPAKLFKTRVEKFYLFFNWKFSLFRLKPKKEGGTEFGIGWIPLGGYVKISGMIDESMDKEQMKKPPQPWEFRAKPAWQRLIMMVGGVSMNVFLAIVIYIGMLWVWGDDYLPNKNAKHGVVADSLGQVLGLEDGDLVLTVGDKEIENFFSITGSIIMEKAETIEVIRNGEKKQLEVPEGFIADLIDLEAPRFIYPRIPFFIGEFGKKSPAKKAGLEVGDQIIGVDSTYSEYFHELRQMFEKNKSKKVEVIALRGNDTIRKEVAITEDGVIGVYNMGIDELLEWKTIEYSFFEAIPAGTKKTFTSINDYLKQLGLIFDTETKAYKSVGSFITIGKLFSKDWDWERFWVMTALLSIMLAVINILPIPALDGGHTLFLLYEMVTRRKPSQKFMEVTQAIGMILLLTLMVLAIGNDFLRHVF